MMSHEIDAQVFVKPKNLKPGNKACMYEEGLAADWFAGQRRT